MCPGLDSKLRRDALKTLNEWVSHQETKDEMIDNDIVESTSELLKDEDHEVRQQAALLIGSFSLVVRGRDRIPAAFEGLQQ